MLENLWSKRRIFEVYLNVIEWGNGVFGAEAAARHYFNTQRRPARPEQAARLAGMVPNPRYYDAIVTPPAWGAKQRSFWPHAGCRMCREITPG
jgi:monofunctional biosynthetic peptidoglycan transglycosylase